MFTCLGVAGGAVFIGLFMLAFALSFTTAVAQAAAKMPRDALAISAAIFNLFMKPPLLVSGYRALEKNVARCFLKASEVSAQNSRAIEMNLGPKLAERILDQF